jgi:hypothetical protein
MLTNRQRAVLCTALFFLLPLLSACLSSPKDNLKDLAYNSPLNQPITLQTQTFTLMGWGHSKGTTHLNVYIEGDGHAWLDPWTISTDPSPPDPVAFRLSIVDPRADSVLYLARPCQYLKDQRCTALDWTSDRFGPKVIAAYHQALDHLKRSWGVKTFTLHGYSGGATVALLIASERQDVRSVMTFAPLLDPAAWTRFHRYSPLSGSISPLDNAKRLRSLHQEHFIGLNDREIPFHLSAAYFEAVPVSLSNIIHKIPDFSHHSDWPTVWKSYILEKIM